MMQFQAVYTLDVEVAAQMATKIGIDLHVKKCPCERDNGLWYQAPRFLSSPCFKAYFKLMAVLFWVLLLTFLFLCATSTANYKTSLKWGVRKRIAYEKKIRSDPPCRKKSCRPLVLENYSWTGNFLHHLPWFLMVRPQFFLALKQTDCISPFPVYSCTIIKVADWAGCYIDLIILSVDLKKKNTWRRCFRYLGGKFCSSLGTNPEVEF